MKEIIIPTTHNHIRYIIMYQQDEEKEELKAMGQNPMDSILFCFSTSERCYSWIVDGKAICIAGISQPIAFGELPCIWIATVDEVKKYKRRFIKGAKIMLDMLKGETTTVGTPIDARLKSTVKWAKSLGFTVDEAAPYGESGAPFHYCHKEF